MGESVCLLISDIAYYGCVKCSRHVVTIISVIFVKRCFRFVKIPAGLST